MGPGKSESVNSGEPLLCFLVRFCNAKFFLALIVQPVFAPRMHCYLLRVYFASLLLQFSAILLGCVLDELVCWSVQTIFEAKITGVGQLEEKTRKNEPTFNSYIA